MHIDYYFPTIIATGDIPDFFEVQKEFKEKTEDINLLLKSDVFNDNVHSSYKKCKDITREVGLIKTRAVMDALFEKYKQHMPRFKDLQMPLINSWINITEPGGFQDMHSHAYDELVGCFYLNVPENSGMLDIAPLFEQASTHHRHTIKPHTGMYVFIPGNTLHRVTYNKSSLQRISLAFNYKVKYDFNMV